MTFKEELEAYAKKTHFDSWKPRDGLKVPDTDDLSLSNEAVQLDGVVLYADLADSTEMVKSHYNWFAAEVYKNYLYCAARVITARGGVITAYDGDRIMAVFIGDSKNSEAAKCGLQINYVVREILRPAIRAQYPSSSYILDQRVGIDASNLFVARTGIRGSNDLVWVGNSANIAAKMSALEAGYSTYISEAVYNMLNEDSKLNGDPKRNMWTDLGSVYLSQQMYGSSWQWGV